MLSIKNIDKQTKSILIFWLILLLFIFISLPFLIRQQNNFFVFLQMCFSSFNL